jgi:DNA-binding XRE family transcriptional regulator
MSQQELADSVGAHWITISKLERGKLRLSLDWVERLSRALGVDPSELYPSEGATRAIYIKGAVGDRGEIVEVFDDEDRPVAEINLAYPDLGEMKWVQIQTDDLYPFFQNGDLVGVVFPKKRDFSAALNRLCIVEFDDGRECLGLLSHGSRAGRYDFRAIVGAPRQDVKPAMLGIVTQAIFQPPLIPVNRSAPIKPKGYMRGCAR